MAKNVPRGLFVGRFQPFHKGHLHLVRRALEACEELVLGVGSSQYSHSARNPFTAAERHEMIQRALRAEGLEGWYIIPIPDVGVHSLWVSHVLTLVPPFDVVFSHDPLTRRLFQEAGVEIEERPLLERERFSGKEIRRRMVAGEDWTELVPAPVAAYIKEIEGVERVRLVAQSGDNDEEQERRHG